MKRVTLHTRSLALELIPELGGAISRFRWRHPGGNEVNLFRPLVADGPGSGDVEQSSAFPLTPFSNRIREGKFTFEGRQISMPRNTSGAHVEHGHGWQRPWQIVEADTEHAVLRYRHQADSWPFEYFVEQRIFFDTRPVAD